jgi:hypothetical protein
MSKALALAGTVLAAVGLCAALTAPQAAALPGQCISTPFGGFCDGQAAADGSFQHCENSGFGVFSYSNCFQACHDLVSNRAVPTDLDPRTPC